VGAAFFSMSEDNVRTKLAQPWMSFCSDAQSVSAEGVFLQRSPHPRTYGSFARVLGKYVREEQVVSLDEAIRRLTSFPAEVLRLKQRGQLTPGYFADVVVFDPQTVQDRATFADPHQYATGVSHVLVNGGVVIRDGDHTGATPGRVVRGPGYKG
jgi:N-acyl-D-amino-acid deacylase